MNKIIIFILLIAGLSIEARAQVKIGYVDVDRALRSIEEGKIAKETIEKELTAKKKELDEKQADLAKKKEEYEKKSLVLSAEVKKEKEEEFTRKMLELREFFSKSQFEMQKREQEVLAPILDKMQEVIDVVAKEKEYHLILEKSRGGVLFARDQDNLTEEVIRRYNEQAQKKK